jgi:hypothetical protein
VARRYAPSKLGPLQQGCKRVASGFRLAEKLSEVSNPLLVRGYVSGRPRGTSYDSFNRLLYMVYISLDSLSGQANFKRVTKGNSRQKPFAGLDLRQDRLSYKQS